MDGGSVTWKRETSLSIQRNVQCSVIPQQTYVNNLELFKRFKFISVIGPAERFGFNSQSDFLGGFVLIEEKI
jgi:hypothetical protein